MNSYHNLDYGKEWTDGNPHEENLQVDLWRPSFPKNFVVAAVLRREGGRVDSSYTLPDRVAPYEQLVFSIPWLKAYLVAHPTDHAFLFFVQDRSFTEKAMRIFAADMKEAGREDLVSKVRVVQDKVALLETGSGDYWILLPDKSVILWRWASLANILLWKPADFPEKECTDYATSSGGCSGTLISPEGIIVPRNLSSEDVPVR